MERLNQYINIALRLALLVLIVTGIVLGIRLNRTLTKFDAALTKLDGTIEETRQAAASIRGFADFQVEQFKNPLNQKLIQQNLAVGAAAISTVRLINTKLIPSIQTNIDRLGSASQDLATLVRRTDASLNNGLLPEATRATATINKSIEATAATLNTSVAKVSEASDTLIKSGVVSLEDLHKILSDGNFQNILAQTAASATAVRHSSENLEASTQSIKDALQYAPDVMQNVQAFSKTQSKYSKFVLLARILRALM